MVKRQHYAHRDHDMAEYKMRTPFGGPTPVYRSNEARRGHVPVVKSSGCCTSTNKQKKQFNHSPAVIAQPPQPHQTTAHQRSHSRLNTVEPFYRYQGGIAKSPRTRVIHQDQNGLNKVHPKQPNVPRPAYRSAPPPT